MIYLILFWEFFKVGLFAVGGGLAALPFLYDLADKYTWFSHSGLTDMIAVAESTPGPLGVNMATYAGFQAAGIGGGVIATLGLILPSFIITLLICRFLFCFAQSPVVGNVFYGLRPAVAGLIAAVAVGLLNISVFGAAGENLLQRFDPKAAILFAILLALILKLKKHPIVYIGAAALVGIIFKF